MAEVSYSTQKACRKCGVVASLDEFPKCVKARDGRAGACTKCKYRSLRAFAASDPERIARHRKVCAERKARYVQNNREAVLARRRELEGGLSPEERAAKKQEKADRKAQSKRLRAEAAQERQRALRASKPWNAEGLGEAERFRIRYRMDPAFNLRQRVRTAMRHKARGVRIASLMREALYRDGRSPTIENMLGYNVAALRKHLQDQFTDGMTWAAFLQGEIHVDHKRPLASFDLSIPEQVVQAWALSNLQPLWAADNRAKAARWAA